MHANNNDYPHPPSSQNLRLVFEIGLIEDKSILIIEILTFLLGQRRPFCSDKYRVSFFLMELGWCITAPLCLHKSNFVGG